MAAHQAPPALGFSRQEHWTGLPFPSPMHKSEKWKWSRSVVPTLSDPMDGSLPGSSIRGIFQARVLEWGAIAFSSCANRLKGWSKGYIRLLLPPSPLPPPSSLFSFSSRGSLLWALSHHPSSAFHSLTTPGNARTTIITFRLIPFLSPCPLKSSTFSSHRLIFLQHRFLSSPFPVQKCLLIPYSPFNNVQKS